jgi:hypothetical protein
MTYFRGTSSGMTLPQDNYFMLCFPHHSFTIQLMLPYLLGLLPFLKFLYLLGYRLLPKHYTKGYIGTMIVGLSVVLCSEWLYLLCFVAVVLVRRISFHALFLSLVGWDSSWDLYSAPLVRLSWFFGPMEVDFISFWRVSDYQLGRFLVHLWAVLGDLSIYNTLRKYFHRFHYNFYLQSECKYYVLLLPTPFWIFQVLLQSQYEQNQKTDAHRLSTHANAKTQSSYVWCPR